MCSNNPVRPEFLLVATSPPLIRCSLTWGDNALLSQIEYPRSVEKKKEEKTLPSSLLFRKTRLPIAEGSPPEVPRYCWRGSRPHAALLCESRPINAFLRLSVVWVDEGGSDGCRRRHHLRPVLPEGIGRAPGVAALPLSVAARPSRTQPRSLLRPRPVRGHILTACLLYATINLTPHIVSYVRHRIALSP